MARWNRAAPLDAFLRVWLLCRVNRGRCCTTHIRQVWFFIIWPAPRQAFFLQETLIEPNGHLQFCDWVFKFVKKRKSKKIFSYGGPWHILVLRFVRQACLCLCICTWLQAVFIYECETSVSACMANMNVYMDQLACQDRGCLMGKVLVWEGMQL